MRVWACRLQRLCPSPGRCRPGSCAWSSSTAPGAKAAKCFSQSGTARSAAPGAAASASFPLCDSQGPPERPALQLRSHGCGSGPARIMARQQPAGSGTGSGVLPLYGGADAVSPRQRPAACLAGLCWGGEIQIGGDQRLFATASWADSGLIPSALTKVGEGRSPFVTLALLRFVHAGEIVPVFFCTAIAPNRASAKAMA